MRAFSRPSLCRCTTVAGKAGPVNPKIIQATKKELLPLGRSDLLRKSLSGKLWERGDASCRLSDGALC